MGEKKWALVIGGSRGIGRATVKELRSRNWEVVFTYVKSINEAKQLEEETGAKGLQVMEEHRGKEWTGHRGSALSAATLEKVREAFPDIFFSAIVFNSGISWIGPTDLMREAQASAIISQNLMMHFHLAQSLGMEMVREKEGSMVFLSSMWGQVGASCETLYSATKGGIDAMVKSLAKEWGPSGVRVNAISPGIINTDMNGELSRDEILEITEEVPLGRMGEPDEVARAIAFLISKDASYITGQIIGVNGGLVV